MYRLQDSWSAMLVIAVLIALWWLLVCTDSQHDFPDTLGGAHGSLGVG